MLRRAEPEMLGMAMVRCELLLSTTLFLSREGLRLSLLRRHSDNVITSSSIHGRRARQYLVNMSWLSVPVGFALSLGVGISYLLLNPHEPLAMRCTAFMYCIGGMVESLAEPLFIIAQANMLTGVRASAECGAALVRGLVTFVLIAWAGWGVQAFGVAQIAYGVAIFVAYVSFFYFSVRGKEPSGVYGFASLAEIFPSRVPSLDTSTFKEATLSSDSVRQKNRQRYGFLRAYVDVETLRLAGYFSFQSVSKHLLTEGDRIILSLGASLYDQGVFIMVQNYGSLVVRVLLQPVEESSRLLFSRMAAEAQAYDSTTQVPSQKEKNGNDTVCQMWSLLTMLLKVMSYLGCLFVCFAINYVPTLLALLPGKKWATSEATVTLSWYCVYVFCLALNGTLEAFVFAVATKRQVGIIAAMHSLCSVLFAVLCIPLMRYLGTAGIVAANCLVMVVRIVFAGILANRFFDKMGITGQVPLGEPRVLCLGVRNCIPHPLVCCTFATAALITRLSERWRRGDSPIQFLAGITFESGTFDDNFVTTSDFVYRDLPHIALGVIVFLFVAATAVVFDASTLRELREVALPKREKTD